MKRLFVVIITLLSIPMAFGQDGTSEKLEHQVFLKGGIGTSWIILPKVFMVDPDPPYNNAQILPATNGLSGFIGIQTVLSLGNGWLFVPEVDLSYQSGEVRVDLTQYPDANVGRKDTVRSSVQELQNYVRAEIPLHFGVRAKDNFWVSFGPTFYFTLYDNKGFENAVYSLLARPDLALNSKNPFGVRFRLAAYAPLGERGYLEIKFESDLSQYFNYENDTYEAKFSFQNISIGYGFSLKAK